MPLNGTLNGSELWDNPWETIFSPFTDLLSTAFYLIPISFIGVALYMKTRDPTLVFAYFVAASMLFGTTGMFIGSLDIARFYFIFGALAITGLVMSLLFHRR